MTPVIVSIGTATPDVSMSQAQLLEMARSLACGELDPRVSRVYQNSGIDRRASVIFFEEDGEVRQRFYEPPIDAHDRGPTTATRLAVFRRFAGALAARASSDAIDRAKISPKSITHLVTASCTGSEAPGLDQAIIHTLECSRDVQRTHLGFMGCHAAINALRVAHAIAQSQEDAVVLVCCVELCTLHFQYGAPLDGQVANALFADGAAAAVVRHNRAGQPALYSIESTASRIFDNSTDAMAWNIGDHGFEMALSIRTPALLRKHVPTWVSEWLGREGRHPADISRWAIHPGGPRVLDELAAALGLDDHAVQPSRDILREHGNMSSATVLFVLDRVRNEMNPAELCLAMAFGPGLAGEGLLVQAV